MRDLLGSTLLALLVVACTPASIQETLPDPTVVSLTEITAVDLYTECEGGERPDIRLRKTYFNPPPPCYLEGESIRVTGEVLKVHIEEVSEEEWLRKVALPSHLVSGLRRKASQEYALHGTPGQSFDEYLDEYLKGEGLRKVEGLVYPLEGEIPEKPESLSYVGLYIAYILNPNGDRFVFDGVRLRGIPDAKVVLIKEEEAITADCIVGDSVLTGIAGGTARMLYECKLIEG